MFARGRPTKAIDPAELRRLLAAKATRLEMAAAFGCSPSLLSQHIRALGLTRRDRLAEPDPAPAATATVTAPAPPRLVPPVSARLAEAGCNGRAASAESRRLRHGPNRLAAADPVTSCDRVYGAEEAEFLAELAAYQARTGRKFPTACEHLAVLKAMGYRRP